MSQAVCLCLWNRKTFWLQKVAEFKSGHLKTHFHRTCEWAKLNFMQAACVGNVPDYTRRHACRDSWFGTKENQMRWWFTYYDVSKSQTKSIKKSFWRSLTWNSGSELKLMCLLALKIEEHFYSNQKCMYLLVTFFFFNFIRIYKITLWANSGQNE